MFEGLCGGSVLEVDGVGGSAGDERGGDEFGAMEHTLEEKGERRRRMMSAGECKDEAKGEGRTAPYSWERAMVLTWQ